MGATYAKRGGYRGESFPYERNTEHGHLLRRITKKEQESAKQRGENEEGV